MAVTPSDRMGLGQGGIKVSKPTELRSALPNQLSRGDHVDAAFTVIHRADIHLSILEAVRANPRVRFHPSTPVRSLEPDEAGAAVSHQNGRRHTGTTSGGE